MYSDKKGDVTVLALVEDGMFEERKWLPVMMYAAMLWDTKSDIFEIMQKAVIASGEEG